MYDFISSLNMHAFPVIITDKNGKVTGKNIAARYHMKDVRVGSLVARCAVWRGDNMIFIEKGDSSFKYGLHLPLDDSCDLYLFLLSLQSGEVLTDFDVRDAITLLKNDKLPSDAPKNARLYGELAEFVNKYGNQISAFDKILSISDIKSNVEYYFSKKWRALGYRASLEFSERVTLKNYFSLNAGAFICALATSAYVSMRISSNGSAQICVDYDDSSNFITVSAAAKTEKIIPSESSSVADAIASLLPECFAELKLSELLSESPSLTRCGISNGIFSMKTYIPASAVRELSLSAPHSVAAQNLSAIFAGASELLKRFRITT